MKRKIPPGIISILVILILIGVFAFRFHSIPNTPVNVENENVAKLIISMDFGREELLEKNVTPGQSVMDTLKSLVNVSTAYGGKFVVAINNISSNPITQEDWFYYVNGILSNMGAQDYIINPGDIIRWDYHSWKDLAVNSELMDFPAMFVHGYDSRTYSLIVAYEMEYEKNAEELYHFFKKMKVNVSMIAIEELKESKLKNCNAVLIGNSAKIIRDLNGRYLKLGWKYYFKDGVVYDRKNHRYRGAFAQITQSPYNPKGVWACENLLLLISGNEEYIPKVINALINHEIESFWLLEGEPI